MTLGVRGDKEAKGIAVFPPFSIRQKSRDARPSFVVSLTCFYWLPRDSSLMNIKEIQFLGLIQNRLFTSITGPEFFRALAACGWKDAHHFFKELRIDAHNRGILTPADLARAIQRGTSEPSTDGKWIHRICHGTAYIVYNPATRGLITFSPGTPPSRK